MSQLIQHIREYHEHSKHYPGRYAEALPFLDWDHQPNPFRHWGTPQVDLPFAAGLAASARGLYQRQEAQPMNLETLGGMLELAFGLSAQKSYDGNQWWLRMNPSSGNLHPTEVHLLAPQGITAGLWHYQPLHHSLELRGNLTEPQSHALTLAGAQGGILLGLTSILIRESWKYGVRAFRYCQLDLGHALAGLTAAAGLYGWECRLLELSTLCQSRLLGLDSPTWPSHEAEEPEAVCYLGPAADLRLKELEAFPRWSLQGSPSQLSSDNLPWQPVEEAAELSRFLQGWHLPPKAMAGELGQAVGPTAEQLIRQRRSGQAYRPGKHLNQEQFFSLLEPLVTGHPLTRLISRQAQLLLFVFQVEGLQQGCYLLSPNAQDLSQMRQILSPRFSFTPIANEQNLSLVQLEPGDARAMAKQAACNQAIASQSSFSLAMLLPLDHLDTDPWNYRLRFWEAGCLGQMLYWEAERLGLRGTGIGCFHDDQIHEYLGLQGDAWQDLYHFTVGLAVEDERLLTAAPYAANRNR